MSNKPKSFRDTSKTAKYGNINNEQKKKEKMKKLLMQIVVGALAIILAIMFSVPALL